MRTAVAFFAVVALASLALTGTATAQKQAKPEGAPTPRGPEQRPGPPPGAGRPGNPQDEQDLRKLVETVKMVRLSQELGLSDEDTIVLVRQYDQARERFAKMNRERQQLLRSLRDNVRAGKGEAEIQEALDKLIAQDRKIADTKMGIYEEVGKDLTATQRAKLYVFINDFESDMRKMIQRAKELNRGGRLRGREGMPGRFGEPGEEEFGGPPEPGFPRPPLGPRPRGGMGPQPGMPPPPEGSVPPPPPPAGPQ